MNLNVMNYRDEISSTTSGSRWEWLGAGRGFVGQAAEPDVAVVDSWLTRQGRTRHIGAHVDRFATACEHVAKVSKKSTGQFMSDAVSLIPDTGSWFPRAELSLDGGEHRFSCWLRPAPTMKSSIELWVCDVPDQRKAPSIKGPDLVWLGEMRRRAVEHGADEALLLSSDGRVLEGTTTSILWWRDGVLCTVRPGPEILPSTTRSAILRAAVDRGMEIRFESPTPDDLNHVEVWAVNALHGIRPVVAWPGSGMTPAPATIAKEWLKRGEF